MESWRIIADSSSDLLVSMVEDEKVKFSIVPLKIIVDQTEYIDNEDVDVAKMLEHMKNFKGSSSSSCPSIEDFAVEMRKNDNSIVVCLTGGLSGTYNCALRAKDIVLEEFPNKKIHVVDTHATSSVSILDVYKAKELIHAGKSFEAIVEEIEAYNANVGLLFVLSSFDTLVKNGRMSPVAGMVAKVLNIRAIATSNIEGKINVIEKARGDVNATKHVIELMGKKKDITGLPVVISHCFNLKAAEALKEKILETYKPSSVTILPNRALASYYSGEGGIIMAF